MRSRAATHLLAIAAIGALACSEASPPSAPGAPAKPPDTGEALAAQGRQAYLSNCIACHNPDPKLEGALGPPVAGASLELIEARVMRAEYPAGYRPKRDTRTMVAMPFLQAQLPALAAYLREVGDS